jgi:hypothetical protein
MWGPEWRSGDTGRERDRAQVPGEIGRHNPGTGAVGVVSLVHNGSILGYEFPDNARVHEFVANIRV